MQRLLGRLQQIASQLVGTIELPEISVESTKGAVAGFLSDLQNQAVRETYRWPTPKTVDGRRDRVRILQRKVLVIQQHVNRCCDGGRTAIVDGCQDPRCLGEGQMRDPRPIGDERLGGCNLLRVIPSDQPDEHVRVNGSHGAS